MSFKVLVVDDSSTMRTIIVRTLGEAGVTDIVEAGDGNMAIQQFREHSPNLIMLDWNMPGKNGLEVLTEIRSMPSDVPIMMVTTEDEKSQVMKALFAGVSDYLVKPFTADALSEKIKALT